MSAFQERIVSDPSDLVISQQSEIFVSTDDDGDVVIHQYRWDEGDVLIFVCQQNAQTLCNAILKAAGFDPDSVLRTAKDPHAAERQRRHREKARDCHGQDGVTVTAKAASDVNEHNEQRVPRPQA
jgi:hypothetical protein